MEQIQGKMYNDLSLLPAPDLGRQRHPGLMIRLTTAPEHQLTSSRISNHECSPVRCSDVREVENVIFESLHALHFSDPIPLIPLIVALPAPLQGPLDAELGPYGAESAHHVSYSPTGN